MERALGKPIFFVEKQFFSDETVMGLTMKEKCWSAGRVNGRWVMTVVLPPFHRARPGTLIREGQPLDHRVFAAIVHDMGDRGRGDAPGEMGADYAPPDGGAFGNSDSG